MEDDKVVIKNVKVEYITTKFDKYENEICYFKLRDKNIDSKFAALMKDDTFNLPWFKSEKGQYILKAKKKYSKTKEFTKDETFLIDIAFKYYKMDNLQGFYVSSLA